jgi:hypothetical protein
MTLSRVYINPSTGVGPDAADLVPFATIMLSPKSMATADRSNVRVSDMVEQAQASQGPIVGSGAGGVKALPSASSGRNERVGGEDVSSVHAWGRNGEARHSAVSKALELLSTNNQQTTNDDAFRSEDAGCVVGADQCVQSFVGMSQCSGKGSWDVCCQYVQAWSNDDCWNHDSGQLILNNMPTVLTPTLLQVLGRVCEDK